MTAKEKAKELVAMFQGAIETPLIRGLKFGDAKQCALIAVDEIIFLLPKRLYWKEVRKEIESI